MFEWSVASVAIAAIVAYLIGSIPFGFIVGKSQGVDLRQEGSCNIGATNAARVLGRKWFFLVFSLDFLKGLAPVMIAYLFAWLAETHQLGAVEFGDIMLSAGAGACLGHVFPLYLGFRGGKAVATGLGVLTGLLPLAAGFAFAIFLLLLFLSRYVSLASVFGALAVPGAFFMNYGGDTWSAPILARFIVMASLAALVVYRHRSNIKRLLDGTEQRIALWRRRRKETENAA